MAVTVENKQLRKVSEEVGTVVKSDINTSFRSCTFDRNGSRFQIVVMKIDETENGLDYIVSVPNFYFSIQTPRPSDIAYKLTERGVMPAIDAESVEIAIGWLMAQ
jgi:hypothetical protein